MEKTSLADQGWELSDLAQYCYASAQRGARQLLEQRGVLPPAENHANGAQWLFSAEEHSSAPAK